MEENGMANKRMFTMKIVDSDAFLDMPLSSQCLYFHLNMRADDDGFVDNPKRIIKIVGASEDDLKLLIVKHFLLCFENGVIVIKHWRMHNTLSKGRYHETQYTDEKASLKLKNNGSYSLNNGGKIDDTNLIEMFSGEQTENKRRTNGEQMENADIDLELDKDKGLDKELEEEKENSVNTIYSCSELKDLAHEQQQPVIEIILNDKSLYPIYQKDIDEWFELYPAVDVIQELRKMKDWCNSNPQKRKTKGGVRRFISGWLSKAQDRGGTHNTGNAYIDSIKNRISEVDNWK
jgi:hypothetical protein